jgi:beta-lactam-binding protein with PASTA domain
MLRRRVLVAVLVVVIAAGVATGLALGRGPTSGAGVVLPNLVGMSIGRAGTIGLEDDLAIKADAIMCSHSTTIYPGIIVAQRPSPGTHMSIQSKLVLTYFRSTDDPKFGGGGC